MEDNSFVLQGADPLIYGLSLEQLLSIESSCGVAISVVMPAGKSLSQTVNLIEEDLASLKKTEVKETKDIQQLKLTIETWEVCLHLLKSHKQPAPRGLMCFAIASPVSALFYTTSKTIATILQPDLPIQRLLLCCDPKPQAWPALEDIDCKERIGIIFLGIDSACFAVVERGYYRVMSNLESNLPKKHGRGGASAVRFARIRLEKRDLYFKRIAISCISHYFEWDQPKVAQVYIYAETSPTQLIDYLTGPTADPRMCRLKFSTHIYDTNLQQTRASVIDSITKEHFPRKVLHREVKEHPSVERLFNPEAVLSKRVVFGAENTFQCLREGLLEEIVLTDSKVVQFKVKDAEGVVEGFAVPELLQGIMTAAPGQYVQLLLEQTPLHSSLTTRLKSIESPPRLTRVACNTPGSKSLSNLHEGIAGLLKAGLSGGAKCDEGTKRALALLGCKSAEDFI